MQHWRADSVRCASYLWWTRLKDVSRCVVQTVDGSVIWKVNIVSKPYGTNAIIAV